MSHTPCCGKASFSGCKGHRLQGCGRPADMPVASTPHRPASSRKRVLLTERVSESVQQLSALRAMGGFSDCTLARRRHVLTWPLTVAATPAPWLRRALCQSIAQLCRFASTNSYAGAEVASIRMPSALGAARRDDRGQGHQPGANDALITHRLYKKRMSHEAGAEIILRGSGGHFDPDVVAAFQAPSPQLQDIASQYGDPDSGIRNNREAVEQLLGVKLPAP